MVGVLTLPAGSSHVPTRITNNSLQAVLFFLYRLCGGAIPAESRTAARKTFWEQFWKTPLDRRPDSWNLSPWLLQSTEAYVDAETAGGWTA